MTQETFAAFQKRMKDYMPRYFDKEGEEISLFEWGRLCENLEYKIIKQEHFGRYFISTVWIGLNMNHFNKSNNAHIFFRTSLELP